MSLVNPNTFEKVWNWLTTASPARKALTYALLGLIVLGGLLFAIDRVSGWYHQRQIEHLKANVNAATDELKGIQANVVIEKVLANQAMENVNVAVKEYANAVNATDTARGETNRALQNMSNAVNGNRPVGVTANDLDRQLKELGQ